jgi:Family of unknown function (DUF6480)
VTNQPTNPEPERTPGLEPGGGVSPGDTPPGESSEPQASIRTPAPKDRQTPTALAVVIGIAVLLGVLFLAWAVVRALEL